MRDEARIDWNLEIPDDSAARLADAILAIPEIAERGWRAIESAPKDGTIFDAWCSCETAMQGGWRIADVVWEDRYKAFYSDDAGVLAKDITHWILPPDPPTA